MIMLSPLKRWGDGIAVNQKPGEKQVDIFQDKGDEKK